MKSFRSLRLLVLAVLVSLVPLSSFAGVFISVGFAPPILPVYDQPPCPEPGLMWAPGYWAYGEDGYYWVPGTWVPAPYEGALWTPPYWGWDGGLYMFHPGYWGRHVGYYGGVNYGYGYMGIGFVGGMWRGRDFVYNTAVMRVDDRQIHNVYIDRTIVERNTIVNDRHVAFSGGPGGIRHDAAPEERFADRDQHMGATSFQQSHVSAAMSDRTSYVSNNGGHPSNLAVQRPLTGGVQGSPAAGRSKSAQDDWNAPTRTVGSPGNGGGNQGRGNYNPSNTGNADTRTYSNPQGNNGNAETRTYNASHSNTGNTPAQPTPQPQRTPEFRQAPQTQPQIRTMPQQQPKPAAQAQPHSAPPPHQNGGQPQHDDSKDHQH
jgi:WXXGXW repeat (2 copies)